MKEAVWIALAIVLVAPVFANGLGLRLSVCLNDTIYTGVNYTKLFKIENLDHETGVTDHISATVGYNISSSNYFLTDVFQVTDLNSYKTANTGSFLPQSAGNYSVCGWTINSSVNDSNASDDFTCKGLVVLEGYLNSSNATNNSSNSSPDFNATNSSDADISLIDNPDSNVAKKNKLEYSIISMPQDIISGEEFETVVEMENEGEEHSIEIWSYVYRGNKCYSGEREENKQAFVIYDDDSVTISLRNTAYAEPGNYKLKVKIRKDELKTPYELTESITVAGEVLNESADEIAANETTKTEETNTTEINMTNKDEKLAKSLWRMPRIVYESADAKAQKIVPYLIAGLTAVFIMLVLFRK